MNRERWSRARGVERDENEAAFRRMRVIVWMFAALLLGSLCLWAGLFVGASVFGGG